MPKKGERMTTAQKEKIRAARIAKNASQPASQPEPTIDNAGGVEVEVTIPTDSKPLSLLDRVKALRPSGTTTTPASKGSSIESEENFIFTLVPITSGFLAYHAATLWADEYKSCAPTKAEVSAVLKPISRIIARRLQFSLKETPDIRDMRIGATALLIYVVRAATTSMEISARLEGEKAIDEAEQHLSRGAGNFRGSQSSASSDRDARERANQDQGSRAGGYGGVSSGGEYQFRNSEPTITTSGLETDAEYARRVIAEAFKQDQQYRSQYGML